MRALSALLIILLGLFCYINRLLDLCGQLRINQHETCNSDMLRNLWIKTKDGKIELEIIGVNIQDEMFYTSFGVISGFDTLFNNYTYLDGSPLGTKVEK